VTMRKIAWFSCGAASAVATKLAVGPVLPVYCDTGAEHPDNKRFMADCEKWFGYHIQILKSDKYESTWDVWEKRKYMAGPDGAPCTMHLKVQPRLDFQTPYDVHVFGYTADANDVARAERMRSTYPELIIETPLIERGLTKAACLDMLIRADIKPPVMYALGFQNNNCIVCPKATSPGYWALIRKHFPDEFARADELSRRLGKKLVRLNDEREFLDKLPADQETTAPIVPDCDFLCAIAEMDLSK
jgi:3'-phosphoadenosine 5'-phosphosulfate sulfotransferase (PAPS reductase)/FAD synthetase